MFRFRLIALLACLSAGAQDRSASLGMFDAQNDVGNVLQPGSAEYNAATKTYTVSGSGENMWFATDEFHFVWKKVSAENLTLAADISILGGEGDGHRKGLLMIRQSLDTDSPYVDAARHGDGLTSLQFRDEKGAITREIESNVSEPKRLRIEKQGDRFYMWVASGDQDLQFSGGSARVEIHAPFYVGIGVCAHHKDTLVKVAFTNVDMSTRSAGPKGKYSTVETVLQSGDARTGEVSREHLTSAGWSADGQALSFEMNGQRRQTAFTPLKTAAPVGAPVSGPSENKFIYFEASHGEQGGTAQIWRKLPDGSHSEQVTSGDFNNVSPYVSPDGKYLLFLRYSKDLKRLPKNRDVELMLMPLADKKAKTLAKFVGGQDSLGTQPWSPDGRRVAFISYQSVK